MSLDLQPHVLGERYRTTSVPVRGGHLRVGMWDAPDPEAPTLLAVHGITSSHVAWPALAALLPDVRIIAPDLRGRGCSRDLPAPYGMPTHADDCAAVLDHLGVAQTVAVGHSMGAFVSVVLADRHPTRVTSLVLVDGGMPLLPPPGVEPAQLAEAVLGPVVARLQQVFASRTAYREHWQEHPAIGPSWSEMVQAYVDYDLVGEEPRLRSATRVQALQEDIRELVDGDSLLGGLARLRHPALWLLAPRGLQDETPPLYPEAARELYRDRYPQVGVAEIEDVNHYTIVMDPAGARQVTPWVRTALAG